MKRHLKSYLPGLFCFFLFTLMIPPSTAIAASSLISAPLHPGGGGVAGACVNLKKAPLTLVFSFRGPSGILASIIAPAIEAGEVTTITAHGITEVAVLRVTRHDGKNLTAKQVKCTLTSLDVNNNPIAITPVAFKFKQ